MEAFIKLSRLSPLALITEGKDSRASHTACLENRCELERSCDLLIFRNTSNVFSVVPPPVPASGVVIFIIPLSSVFTRMLMASNSAREAPAHLNT